MSEINETPSLMYHHQFHTPITEMFIKELLQKQSAEIELLNRRIDRLEKQNATTKPQNAKVDLVVTEQIGKLEDLETQKRIMRIDQENRELKAQVSQISEEIAQLHPCAQHVDKFKAEFSKLNKDNHRFKQQIIKLSSTITQLQPFITEMIDAKKEFKEVRKEFQRLMPIVDELGDVNTKIQSMLKIISYLTEYMVINEKSKETTGSAVAPVESEEVVVSKYVPKQNQDADNHAVSTFKDDTKSSPIEPIPEIPESASSPLSTLTIPKSSFKPVSTTPKHSPPPITATSNRSQMTIETSKTSLAVLFGLNSQLGLLGSFLPGTKKTSEVAFTISNMIFTKERK